MEDTMTIWGGLATVAGLGLLVVAVWLTVQTAKGIWAGRIAWRLAALVRATGRQLILPQDRARFPLEGFELLPPEGHELWRTSGSHRGFVRLRRARVCGVAPENEISRPTQWEFVLGGMPAGVAVRGPDRPWGLVSTLKWACCVLRLLTTLERLWALAGRPGRYAVDDWGNEILGFLWAQPLPRFVEIHWAPNEQCLGRYPPL